MANFNKIILVGHITKDPELKQTNSGIAVTSFCIAVNRKYGDNKTDFINIVCWRQTAEFVTRYFTKGQAILVSGQLQVREYEKNGETKEVYEVVADEVTFVERKQETKTEYKQDNTFEELSDDDDLPF